METVAKPARFMCGRAIKPVRPPGGTIELFKAKPSEHVIGDGSDDSLMTRRHRVLGKCLRLGGVAADFCDSL